ncbi:unnamed protein product [Phyllotreta striolata]|uniref:Digestive organ expansion factor-like protein n=1 Tax=Phyllotreta striolata TaxID=444603 RepID=A0A9N9TTX7_PHYSR|nr:unnamed protein product [Phyllotreta striolata]
MARRGKLKYKDVVKNPYDGQKKNAKKFKPPKKTYSLFSNKQGKNNPRKRKFAPQKSYEPQAKEPKVESNALREEESSSEEEAADVDNLLSTFKKSDKIKNIAIESSSDSELDEENGADENDLGEELTEGENEESGSEDEDTGNQDDNDIEIHVALENEEVGDLKEINSSTDPFNQHISYDLHDSMLDSLQSSPVNTNNFEESWPQLGNLIIQIPKCEIIEEKSDHFTISEKKTYALQGAIPKQIKLVNFENLHIKSQITNNLLRANKSVTGNEHFTTLQEEIFSIINNYQDLYYPERTFTNSEEIRYTYCLHAVNHVLKTKLKVIHHNARLTKKDDVPEEFRDQGLVRPKVLIILPFKDSAYKTIQIIIDLILAEDNGNVMNKKRFLDDYTGNELFISKKNPKPEDYEQIFQGNTSDDFKIGITVTKKSIKLFAEFYASDIIIASPLGLRTVLGAEGEPERDYDFLASIELLVMDQSEIFLMQNWDHVMHIFNHLHMQPKNSHGTDFSRVRTWSLNGWSKYYRQTLLFSSVNFPEINAIFNKKCQNFAGKIKVVNPIRHSRISQVVVQVPHVFHKFNCKNAIDAIDMRFDFFINKILPQQKEPLMKQTLVFVQSYFDFVRLRNYFKKEDVSFVQICEYSKEGKVARARDMFYHGDAHFLLYTERFHFFHRKRIKGIRHIVFYQLPTCPHFYYEMCNLMQEANMNRKIGSSSNMSVTVLYSKYDVYQLSAVVGTEKSGRMIQSDRNVHMMVTGND